MNKKNHSEIKTTNKNRLENKSLKTSSAATPPSEKGRWTHRSRVETVRTAVGVQMRERMRCNFG